ncbi:MAG: hypothetical protein RL219_467 [Actinomycetota bacterium]|jgi:hypothetical protein
MLTAPDEHFNHQVAFPHALVGSSDPSWRERYWVSMQDTRDGSTVLTLGFGQYPNQDVQEAFVSLTHRGRQRNLRLSRRLTPRRDVMQVGPLSCDIVEPYRRLRFALADNPSEMSFDIDWLGRFDPFLEERHFETAGPRVTHDLVRYVQVGRAEGELRVDGERITLSPDDWWGERDHSWGVRPLPRSEGAPPTERPDWRFLLFMPVQFEDFGMHLYLFEDADGTPTHLSCGLMGESVSGARVLRVSHDLEFEHGAPTPTLVGGSIDVTLLGGRILHVDVTALSGRAHLRGGGYGGIDGWFQGHWKGEDSLVHDTWDLSDRAQLKHWGANSSDHAVQVACEGQHGFGVAEYMVLGGHQRYGHVRR